MRVRNKILTIINLMAICAFFFAMVFASCSKDTLSDEPSEPDEPDKPQEHLGKIPEWVKNTGFYLSDTNRGVEGYAVMYDLSAKSKSAGNPSKSSNTFGCVTVVFSVDGKVHVWGLVDFPNCDRWVKGHLSDNGDRIVLDAATDIYGSSSSTLSGAPLCRIVQIKTGQDGVYELLDNQPIVFRITDDHDLAYEKPEGCADGDICGFGMYANASAASNVGIMDGGNAVYVYDNVDLDLRNPQLVKNSANLEWHTTKMTYKSGITAQCEVAYAYDGDWFYLRIDGNVITGKIKGTKVVFDIPQTTCPGLDVPALNNLYCWGKTQTYLCFVDSRGMPIEDADELRLRFKVTRTEEGDPSDPVLVTTCRLESANDYGDSGKLCFRYRNEYDRHLDAEKSYRLPLVIEDIKNFPGNFEDYSEPVFNDPYDPYIAGTWRRDGASGHTWEYTEYIFSSGGEYKKHEVSNYFGWQDPDYPPDHIDHDDITEKGTWKTERGCLIREWRWTYGGPEYTERVHRDTIRYRSKLLGDYLSLKGTYLEGCERW